MDEEKMANVFTQRVGEIMRYVHGIDYNGVLARHVAVKELLHDGSVTETDVLKQLDESPDMSTFDAWLNQKTTTKNEAHDVDDNTESERIIVQNVNFMSGTMAKKWLPILLRVPPEDFDYFSSTSLFQKYRRYR